MFVAFGVPILNIDIGFSKDFWGHRAGLLSDIKMRPFLQGGAPPSYKWVIIPLTIDISPTKTIVIGLICTNLANELGHHLVGVPIIQSSDPVKIPASEAGSHSQMVRFLVGQFWGPTATSVCTDITIFWWLPKMGVPLVIIPFRLGFSLTHHPAIGDPPFRETSIYLNMILIPLQSYAVSPASAECPRHWVHRLCLDRAVSVPAVVPVPQTSERETSVIHRHSRKHRV